LYLDWDLNLRLLSALIRSLRPPSCSLAVDRAARVLHYSLRSASSFFLNSAGFIQLIQQQLFGA